jgi:hypothetical protein
MDSLSSLTVIVTLLLTAEFVEKAESGNSLKIRRSLSLSSILGDLGVLGGGKAHG